MKRLVIRNCSEAFRRALAGGLVLLATLFAAPAAGADYDSEIVEPFLFFFAPDTQKQQGRQPAGIYVPSSESRLDPTLAYINLFRNWDTLRPETRERLAPIIKFSPWRDGKRTVYFGEPGSLCTSVLKNTPTRTIESDHFKITFTLTGNHKVSGPSENGIPTYITNMILTFEHIWDREINAIGLPAPPLPPDNKYPINVCDINGSTGYLAWTISYEESSNHTAKSFIEMDNDYTNEGIHLYNNITIDQFVQVIAAHEFFHAVQFGINFYSPTSWFLEMNAVWMEDEVYPTVNDYIPSFLVSRLNHTNVSIDHYSMNDTYAYGSGIFLKYITEHITGPRYIVDLWNEIGAGCLNLSNHPWCYPNSSEIPLISQTLADNYGAGLNTVFRDYSTALYTKDFVDGPLDIFPDVRTTRIEDAYPVTVTGTLDHMASDYYTLTPDGGSNAHTLNVAFAGASNASWEASVITIDRGGNFGVSDIPLNSGAGSIGITGFGASFATAVVVISNVHETRNNQSYSFTASAANGCDEPAVSEQFPAGWHLVSLPFIPGSDDADAALSLGGGQLTGYDPQTGGPVLNPSIGESGRGYWLFLASPGTISAASCPNTNPSQAISLKLGWNIFGNPFGAAVGWNDSNVKVLLPGSSAEHPLSRAEDNGWLTGAIYYDYNGLVYSGSSRPNNGYNLAPWKGYWINAVRDVILKIAAP